MVNLELDRFFSDRPCLKTALAIAPSKICTLYSQKPDTNHSEIDAISFFLSTCLCCIGERRAVDADGRKKEVGVLSECLRLCSKSGEQGSG